MNRFSTPRALALCISFVVTAASDAFSETSSRRGVTMLPHGPSAMNVKLRVTCPPGASVPYDRGPSGAATPPPASSVAVTLDALATPVATLRSVKFTETVSPGSST